MCFQQTNRTSYWTLSSCHRNIWQLHVEGSYSLVFKAFLIGECQMKNVFQHKQASSLSSDTKVSQIQLEHSCLNSICMMSWAELQVEKFVSLHLPLGECVKESQSASSITTLLMWCSQTLFEEKVSGTNLSSENNLLTFRLNAPVVIRAKVKGCEQTFICYQVGTR